MAKMHEIRENFIRTELTKSELDLAEAEYGRLLLGMGMLGVMKAGGCNDEGGCEKVTANESLQPDAPVTARPQMEKQWLTILVRGHQVTLS